nr:MAG TPA: hypothetical protein [Bacteriophage sp.]DAS02275.1 MAG TPA: hypothetical protein [Caudoviricetes sp.]
MLNSLYSLALIYKAVKKKFEKNRIKFELNLSV